MHFFVIYQKYNVSIFTKRKKKITIFVFDNVETYAFYFLNRYLNWKNNKIWSVHWLIFNFTNQQINKLKNIFFFIRHKHGGGQITHSITTQERWKDLKTSPIVKKYLPKPSRSHSWQRIRITYDWRKGTVCWLQSQSLWILLSSGWSDWKSWRTFDQGQVNYREKICIYKCVNESG